MKKTITILLACYIILFCRESFCFEIVPLLFHVHTTISDGQHSPQELKKRTIELGYRGIAFTDHSECFTDDKRWCRGNFFTNTQRISYPEYLKEINSLNKDHEFITLVGREIPAGHKPHEVLCHINTFSVSADPYTYTTDYALWELPQILKKLNQEEGVIYIFNHPKDCTMWEMGADRFHGIELFNDLVGRFGFYTEIKKMYEYQFGIYANSIYKGWRGFVVGGMDLHHDIQYLKGEITTYVFPDEFTQKSAFRALGEGRTIATRDLEILDINIYPSRVPREIKGNIVISGKVRVSPKYSGILKLFIYRNGTKYKRVFLKREPSLGWELIYSFYFEEDSVLPLSTSYFLEIPEFLVSSLFIFEKKDSRHNYKCSFERFSSPYCLLLTSDSDIQGEDEFYVCDHRKKKSFIYDGDTLIDCDKLVGTMNKKEVVFRYRGADGKDLYLEPYPSFHEYFYPAPIEWPDDLVFILMKKD